MMKSLSLELKIIFYVVVFSLFLIIFQRYYLLNSIENEYSKIKESKNAQLIETITPIIALNLELGLQGANKVYLDEIASKNSDIKHIEILTNSKQVLYSFTRYPSMLDPSLRNHLNYAVRDINDSLDASHTYGHIGIDFFEDDLKGMQKSYREIAFFTLLISLLATLIFLPLLKRQFQRLRKLREDVMAYDPATGHCTITTSKQNDEVGIIQNAIATMICRLNDYAKTLDTQNRDLEQMVQNRTKALKIANEKLAKLSSTDVLTQLPKRRHFEQQFVTVHDNAAELSLPICVIICDIDFFKKINDTYGHLSGDKVLKEIAYILENSIAKASDYVARLGGEEFVYLMPDANIAQALKLCDTIATSMMSLKIPVDKNAFIEGITFSFGICIETPSETMSRSEMLKRADEPLYEAKEQGRNRAVIFGESTSSAL